MDFTYDFTDRDLAFFILDYPDYDAQLLAIRNLLRLRKHADEKFEQELKEIEEFGERATGSASQQAADERVDHLHGGVFEDAAHSMAAVGMLAPFLESLFQQAFYGIERRLRLNGRSPNAHTRWSLTDELRWDCHHHSDGEANLVRGIFELAEATGLAPLLPSHLRKTLDALFGYRNKMFHLGFEWPPKDRVRFAQRIVSDGWPTTWFEKSTSGPEPWIFYMSHAFVDHCLGTIEEVLAAFGAFVRMTK